MDVAVVGEDPLERPYVHRLIEVLSVAVCLTRVVTDPAAHPWERVVLAEQVEGFVDRAPACVGKGPSNVVPYGAGLATRRRSTPSRKASCCSSGR